MQIIGDRGCFAPRKEENLALFFQYECSVAATQEFFAAADIVIMCFFIFHVPWAVHGFSL